MFGENFRRFSNEYPSWVLAMVGEYRIIKKAIEHENYKIHDYDYAMEHGTSRYDALNREKEQYWDKMLSIFMRDYSNETSVVDAFERRFK